MFNRVIILVLDSVGIGALPDAARYGDIGADTLGNIARSQGGLFLPALQDLGLGRIAPLEGVEPVEKPRASFGKMAEVSDGKDTTTGHWEMSGCLTMVPFPYYPDGFPQEVIDSIIRLTGRQVLGNKAASGTEIIAELGEEHMKSGALIVYTSADSVLQIAAHEEIVPVAELNRIGKLIREEVCVGEHSVGRVITRPFIGKPGRFTRTSNRHDFSLQPCMPTILDRMHESGRWVISIGKIADIFAGRGFTASYPTKSNDHGMHTLLRLIREKTEPGMIFANLVEFDSGYGHRNDAPGYARALQRMDAQLAILLPELTSSDLLIITADHGCDPTTPGTDHSREYVPLLAYSPEIEASELGIRKSFSDIAATIADNFGLEPMHHGESFLPILLKR